MSESLQPSRKLPPTDRDFEIYEAVHIRHQSTWLLADRHRISQTRVRQIIRRFRDLDMPLDEIREVVNAPDVVTRNRALVAHLDDPATTVIDKILVQAWGRKPE